MRLPTLFISHGAPDLLEQANPAADFLRGMASLVPRPTAIVVISAHWCSQVPCVESSERPRTLHDFSGFSESLHLQQYPALGSRKTAQRMSELLGAQGIPVTMKERGLDHGAWVPLKLAWPKADIPVTQISLQPHLGAAHHAHVGNALAPLRDEGVLIIGSGSATHNLGEIQRGNTAPSWVQSFDNWLVERAVAGDAEGLQNADHQESYQRNHPSPEHFLPLIVAQAAAGPRAQAKVLHRSATYGVLAMTMLRFE